VKELWEPVINGCKKAIRENERKVSKLHVLQPTPRAVQIHTNTEVLPCHFLYFDPRHSPQDVEGGDIEAGCSGAGSEEELA
jgi:hypothetical protein